MKKKWTGHLPYLDNRRLHPEKQKGKRTLRPNGRGETTRPREGESLREEGTWYWGERFSVRAKHLRDNYNEKGEKGVLIICRKERIGAAASEGGGKLWENAAKKKGGTALKWPSNSTNTGTSYVL